MLGLIRIQTVDTQMVFLKKVDFEKKSADDKKTWQKYMIYSFQL